MLTTVNIPIESFNDVYVPLLTDKKRRNIIYGSRDSAKSHFVAQKLIIDCLELPYFLGLMVRKQYNTIKESQWAKIKQIVEGWGLDEFFTFTKSPLEIRCVNGNRFIARGMDDPGKSKSVTDPTHAWYEECNQLSYNDWITTTLGLRNTVGTPIKEYFTFNSETDKTWLVREFFPPLKSFEKDDGTHTYIDSIRSDTTILHTCYKHNQFITQDRIDILEGLRGDEYKVNGLGLFGRNLEGLIYPKYNVIDNMPYELCKHQLIGGDFGFDDPNAFVRVGVNAKHTDLYVEELIYKGNMDEDELIRVMGLSGIKKLEKGYLDPSEPGTIKAINKAGYRNMWKALKDAGSIKAGIKKVKKYNIHVTKSSKNIIDELDNYRMATDRYGESLGVPEDKNNHAMDAMRYPIYTSFYKRSSTIVGVG